MVDRDLEYWNVEMLKEARLAQREVIIPPFQHSNIPTFRQDGIGG
jgi:hypothetical protein